MKPLAINKEFVLMFSLRQVQDRYEVTVASRRMCKSDCACHKRLFVDRRAHRYLLFMGILLLQLLKEPVMYTSLPPPAQRITVGWACRTVSPEAWPNRAELIKHVSLSQRGWEIMLRINTRACILYILGRVCWRYWGRRCCPSSCWAPGLCVLRCLSGGVWVQTHGRWCSPWCLLYTNTSWLSVFLKLNHLCVCLSVCVCVCVWLCVSVCVCSPWCLLYTNTHYEE